MIRNSDPITDYHYHSSFHAFERFQNHVSVLFFIMSITLIKQDHNQGCWKESGERVGWRKGVRVRYTGGALGAAFPDDVLLRKSRINYWIETKWLSGTESHSQRGSILYTRMTSTLRRLSVILVIVILVVAVQSKHHHRN